MRHQTLSLSLCLSVGFTLIYARAAPADRKCRRIIEFAGERSRGRRVVELKLQKGEESSPLEIFSDFRPPFSCPLFFFFQRIVAVAKRDSRIFGIFHTQPPLFLPRRAVIGHPL